MPSTRPLVDGIYSPTVVFFKDSFRQELDIPATAAHFEWQAKAGIKGLVVMGMTGEAVTLSRDERNQVTATARTAMDKVGNNGPVIVGTVGAQSTLQAIELCADAAQHGGDYALVLPPTYFAPALDKESVLGYYRDIADASPIPILIYTYPKVCSGLDMDSELLEQLANHPRIVGVKHTDHDLGKIARLTNRSFDGGFSVFGGATDYLISALAIGAQGAITWMANIAPRACVKVINLWRAGKQDEALVLAKEISRTNWGLSKGWATGAKYAAAYFRGLPESVAYPRRPLPRASEQIKECVRNDLAELAKIEKKLEEEGYAGIVTNAGPSISGNNPPTTENKPPASSADSSHPAGDPPVVGGNSGRGAINFPSRKYTFFFKGDQYVVITWSSDHKNDKVFHGPAKVPDVYQSLKKVGFHVVDAILPIPGQEDYAYFFSGSEYVRINSMSTQLQNGPHSITKNWASLAKAGFSGIDGVIMVPGTTDQAYFFSGERYCRIKFTQGKSDDQLLEGPEPIMTRWPEMKFKRIDTIIPDPEDPLGAYVFSGDQYAQIKLVGASTTTGPKNLLPDWQILRQVGFY